MSQLRSFPFLFVLIVITACGVGKNQKSIVTDTTFQLGDTLYITAGEEYSLTTDETFNINAFKKMGELGLLGITADPKYGGAGLGATAIKFN